MSDFSQGPGWWQASDGKWYPPHQAPGYLPHPDAAPTELPQPAAPGFPQPTAASALGDAVPTPPPTTPLPPTMPNPGMPLPGVPSPGLPQPGFPGGVTPQFPAPQSVKRGTNGLAIAGLVLAILWLCAVGSLLGLIFGIIGMRQAARRGQGGRGAAIAAIVIGALGLVVTATAVGIGIANRDKLVETSPDERDDITILGCGVPEGTGSPAADLSITNDSSKRSTYLIAISFNQPGRSQVVATAQNAGTVDPGETVDVSLTATEESGWSGEVSCDLELVQRFAAG